jgi:hypothetical protein
LALVWGSATLETNSSRLLTVVLSTTPILSPGIPLLDSNHLSLHSSYFGFQNRGQNMAIRDSNPFRALSTMNEGDQQQAQLVGVDEPAEVVIEVG